MHKDNANKIQLNKSLHFRHCVFYLIMSLYEHNLRSQQVFFSFKLILDVRTPLLEFVLMQVPNHSSYAGGVARKPIIETIQGLVLLWAVLYCDKEDTEF